METVDAVEAGEARVIADNANSLVLDRDEGSAVLVLPSRDVQCRPPDRCRHAQDGEREEDSSTGTVDHGPTV